MSLFIVFSCCCCCPFRGVLDFFAGVDRLLCDNDCRRDDALVGVRLLLFLLSFFPFAARKLESFSFSSFSIPGLFSSPSSSPRTTVAFESPTFAKYTFPHEHTTATIAVDPAPGLPNIFPDT